MIDVFPYIDRYFNGELSSEEKKTFEERCLADPAFVRMVALYISLLEHSQQQWAERKKEQFARLEAESFFADEPSFFRNGALNTSEQYWIEDETEDANTVKEVESNASLKEEPFAGSIQEESMNKEGARVRPMKWWKWLAAAALLGVIATGISLYVQSPEHGVTVATNLSKERSTKKSPASNNASTQNNIVVDTVDIQTDKKGEAPKKRLDKAEQQQLFAQNFVPDAPPKQKSELPLLEEAFDHYEKGSYKQATAAYEETEEQVESLTTRAPENEQDEAVRKQILFYAYYYNALCYMASGDAAKAISMLEAIKESPDTYWYCKQQWYLALAYLKTGELTKATALLKEVATSKQAGDYSRKAIQLMKELKVE